MIPWAKPEFWGDEQDFVVDALDSTWISGGPYVEQLESEFRQYLDCPYALTSCNGTAALHLAFLGLNLKAEDEVIVPGYAFMGAANVACLMGALPVFADIDPHTWCITAETIEKCISPRTRAIVVIHTYGNVCEMDEILSLAKNKQIPVIEDTAEALASKYKSKMTGTMGTIGTYSFHATKTITTGEGGMVTTADQDIYERMWLYRNHGMLRKVYYWHELTGHNFRLTNLQAALGCAQFRHIDKIIEERKRVHQTYRQLLQNTPGITLQHYSTNADAVLWAMAVRLDQHNFPQGRDAVMKQMHAADIETRPGFYAASQLEHFCVSAPPLPISEEISPQVISLPTFPTLQDDQIEYICETLKNC